jgi:branched-chain amino acid transport system substrate-binding protein
MKQTLVAAAALLLLPGVAQADTQTFKIGVLNDQSSLYSDLTGSGSVTAAKMAVEDFGGKVLDRPIEIVTADHQNKADVGSAIARRWIDVDGVQVIVDVPASSVAFAVQEIARETKTPFLISGAASSDLTGKACSPYSVHWTYDTYALAAGTARGVVRTGGKDWFFITQDNAFGQSLQRDISKFVEEAGGKVLGSVSHPLNTSDFSSYLLQAQAAKPQVVALATAGSDFTNALKQSSEFGLVDNGIKIVGTSVTINDVHSLGLDTAKGVQFAAPFYWDQTPETREWSERFKAVEGKMPNHIHAGVYGAVKHYLEAVQAVGPKALEDRVTIVEKMKETPINDFFTKDGKIRADGKVLRPFYLFEVKAPDESRGEWDLLKELEVIPAEDTAVPLADSACPMVKS